MKIGVAVFVFFKEGQSYQEGLAECFIKCVPVKSVPSDLRRSLECFPALLVVD